MNIESFPSKNVEKPLDSTEQKEFSRIKEYANYKVISDLVGLSDYNEARESDLQAIFDESKSMEDLESKMDVYFFKKSEDKKANYAGFLNRIKGLKENNDVKDYFELLKGN
jgi:hypothetical protein